MHWAALSNYPEYHTYFKYYYDIVTNQLMLNKFL